MRPLLGTKGTPRTWVVATISAALAAGFVTIGTVGAQPRVPPLPGCDSDGIVVSRNGKLVCERTQPALGLAFCNDGDHVVTDAFGRLRCERPGATSSGPARGLLPSCSTGEVLVSEGGGAWRCRPPPLPNCSSGEILVSEGSGSWKCTKR